jgi:hypothetical protein
MDIKKGVEALRYGEYDEKGMYISGSEEKIKVIRYTGDGDAATAS